MRVHLKNNEKILYEHYCSHMKGIEAVGGKVMITNKRIIFQSHNFNIQNHECEFLMKNVKSIDSNAKLYKYFPGTGVKITFRDETSETFSPRDRKKFVESIEKSI